jgi:hypothetical protein
MWSDEADDAVVEALAVVDHAGPAVSGVEEEGGVSCPISSIS